MIYYPPNSTYDPGVFKGTFSGPLGWPMGVDCRFDSSLSTDSVSGSSNATLTLDLKLLLNPRDRNSGIPLKTEDGKDFPVRDWDVTTHEFAKFRDAVKAEAEKFWNATGFCLTVPSDYRGLDWPANRPSLHPNVDCRFTLSFARGQGDAHAVIDCFRPDYDDAKLNDFRSNAGSGRGQFTSFDTAMRNTLLTKACEKRDFVFTGTDLNMEYQTIQAKCVVQQMTLPHEVGHLLGLPHVGIVHKNPDCLASLATKPNGSDHSCYTGPQPNDATNVMGGGMDLDTWNAMPWALRLVDHLGIHPSGIGILTKSIPPRKI